MERTRNWCAAMLAVFVLAACGPGQVVVHAEVDLVDPETGETIVRPLSDLRVQLLPYDRDQVFDSLTASAPRAEPQMPAELAARRDSIDAARAEWTDAESRWLAARDRLQEINQEIQQYSPAEAQYRVLVQEFDRFDAQAREAERVKDSAFERFDSMQQAALADLEAFRAQVIAWEDEAFADFDLVIAQKVQASGLQVLTDTTDATGMARVPAAPGAYWVHARHPLATDELYWNLPITVERGDPVEVHLTRSNAETRELF